MYGSFRNYLNHTHSQIETTNANVSQSQFNCIHLSSDSKEFHENKSSVQLQFPVKCPPQPHLPLAWMQSKHRASRTWPTFSDSHWGSLATPAATVRDTWLRPKGGGWLVRIPRPSTSQTRCSMGLRSGERDESTQCTLPGG